MPVGAVQTEEEDGDAAGRLPAGGEPPEEDNQEDEKEASHGDGGVYTTLPKHAARFARKEGNERETDS